MACDLPEPESPVSTMNGAPVALPFAFSPGPAVRDRGGVFGLGRAAEPLALSPEPFADLIGSRPTRSLHRLRRAATRTAHAEPHRDDWRARAPRGARAVAAVDCAPRLPPGWR